MFFILKRFTQKFLLSQLQKDWFSTASNRSLRKSRRDFHNAFDIFFEKLKACLDKLASLIEKKLDLVKEFSWQCLRKAVMSRSQLKMKLNHNKSVENSKKYKQQRNYCVKHLRKTKMELFQNIDVSKIYDNKITHFHLLCLQKKTSLKR